MVRQPVRATASVTADVPTEAGLLRGDAGAAAVGAAGTTLQIADALLGGHVLELLARRDPLTGDASGDGRADIYVARGNDKRNKPDRLLVSRNRGTKFASVKIPTTSKGSADDVIALDYDRNGLTDFVVVNGENAAGGFGLTPKICNQFFDAGADAITTGNHVWDQREALVFIERTPRLLRPVNYPAGTPGRGVGVFEARNGFRH